MALSDLMGYGGGFVALRPVTLTAGEITAFGTQQSFIGVEGETATIANGRLATEYITKELTQDVTIRAARNQVTVDAATGATVSAGDAKDTFQFTVTVTQAEKAALVSLIKNGTPVAVAWGVRNAVTKALEEYNYLLGYLEGDLSVEGGANFVSLQLTVAGGVGFVADEAVDDLTFSALTPTGLSATTPSTVATTNFTTLLSGEIVTIAL